MDSHIEYMSNFLLRRINTGDIKPKHTILRTSNNTYDVILGEDAGAVVYYGMPAVQIIELVKRNNTWKIQKDECLFSEELLDKAEVLATARQVIINHYYKIPIEAPLFKEGSIIF